MTTTGTITTGDLGEFARDRAVAEAAEWAAMLAYRDAAEARIARIDSSMERLVERSGIPVAIGQAMGLSAHQVSLRLASADRLTQFAPQTWLAFRSGDLDAARARDISSTLMKLERPESRRRLDQSVVAYASTHTAAELRQWLRRFVVRVEPDLMRERAEAERERRHVKTLHGEEGMSWLEAYLPSHHAAAIGARLRREAKALGADDPRTRAQREADLLVQWSLTEHADTGTTSRGLRTDIAVTLDARVLTGLSDGYAESADGSWDVPAEWLLESALVGQAFWHRLLVDPIIGDTLAHEYVGRFAPDLLRRAIAFRDGVCATDGCLRPADECDLDHRQPWPDGPTSGSNIDPRCKRDHNLKGHGILQRLHAHHARSRPPHRTRHRLPPHDVLAASNDLAWLLLDHDLASVQRVRPMAPAVP